MLEQILSGNRRALSQAITLVESESPQDRAQASLLLESLLKHRKPALRIGISGPPGAGKSSLIESFGLYLLNSIQKIAILSIDPSSQISNGSILGDKTRMQRLSQDERVFIRSSPSKSYLGGVSKHTEEAMLVCEAAGFDIILLESVGVGQSESDISSLVDVLILVLAPASGDELQGIKRGLLELGDLIVINKTDGDLKKQAEQTRLAYHHAVHLMGHETPVLCVSALEKTGLENLWEKIQAFKPSKAKQNFLLEQRFWNLAQQRLLADFKSSSQVQTDLPNLLNQVRSKKITSWQALQHFFLISLL
ncbi:MAG: methylmalonyl Co-A mutase-associated GTPase MeaB, partial [Myxococcaceae bacterium]